MFKGRPFFAWEIAAALLWSMLSYASVFGTLKAIVHDPAHRPVKLATVVVRSRTSSWSRTVATDENGLATLLSVPVGEYEASVSAPGFQPQTQMLTIASDSTREVHFALQIATVQQRIEVSAEPELVNPASSTTQSLISRRQIRETPGADRTNSLAMITDFVPGAYVVHDQLHIRGGHQVTWAIDGVPIPNTNIASNVGPQFDP